MKRELRRIEETLHQIDRNPPALLADEDVPSRSQSTASATKSPSFDLQPKAAKSVAPQLPLDFPPSAKQASPNIAAPTVTLEPEAQAFVQPFSPEETESKTPNLPKFKTPSFSSHRNGANPALATSLLNDIQTIVEGWQTELHQVLREIQSMAG
jgi:hypothetical protein